MREGEFDFSFSDVELFVNGLYVGMLGDGGCRIHWMTDSPSGWEITDIWFDGPAKTKIAVTEMRVGRDLARAIEASIQSHLETVQLSNRRLMAAISDDMQMSGYVQRTDLQEHGLGINQLI